MNLPDMALANDAWQECMTDEQMEKGLEIFEEALKEALNA